MNIRCKTLVAKDDKLVYIQKLSNSEFCIRSKRVFVEIKFEIAKVHGIPIGPKSRSDSLTSARGRVFQGESPDASSLFGDGRPFAGHELIGQQRRRYFR